jgi:hypothetical protein
LKKGGKLAVLKVFETGQKDLGVFGTVVVVVHSVDADSDTEDGA